METFEIEASHESKNSGVGHVNACYAVANTYAKFWGACECEVEKRDEKQSERLQSSNLNQLPGLKGEKKVD